MSEKRVDTSPELRRSEPSRRLPRISVDAAPVQSRVAEAIRIAIFAGRFMPGDRLIERHICEQTGASRTAVREALRELEAEGLVERAAGKGVAIPTIDSDQARDIYEVRKVLEALAVRLFSERASDSERHELIVRFRQFADVVEDNKSEHFIRAKDEFYKVLITGAHNSELSSVLTALHARITLLRSVTSAQPGRLKASLTEIHRIVDAIAEQRTEDAVTAVEEHIDNAGRVAQQAIEAGFGRASGARRSPPNTSGL